jgi:hypothetical protein
LLHQDTHGFAAAGEMLRIKLLQMCTLVIQCNPPRMGYKPHLSAVVKLCWKHMKQVDDSPCKAYAFVTMAHLLKQHPYGEKIIMQVRGTSAI